MDASAAGPSTGDTTGSGTGTPAGAPPTGADGGRGPQGRVPVDGATDAISRGTASPRPAADPLGFTRPATHRAGRSARSAMTARVGATEAYLAEVRGTPIPPQPTGAEPQPAPPARPTGARLRRYRSPQIALPAMILFGLLAAFFAWQAAEPLWLSLGRGGDGVASAARCDASDGTVAGATPGATDGAAPATYPCVVFTAADGAFEVADVDLRGAGSGTLPEDTSIPARMVSADSPRAYATSSAGLHLRWSTGLALVLACGAGLAWATGATRLDTRGTRRWAITLSFAGPLLLATGFLGAAY